MEKIKTIPVNKVCLVTETNPTNLQVVLVVLVQTS